MSGGIVHLYALKEPKERPVVASVNKWSSVLGIAGVAILMLTASALAQKPVMLDGMLLGYDLDLPDPPSIEQQIAAGKQQVEFLREQDQTLDSEGELVYRSNARLIDWGDAFDAAIL